MKVLNVISILCFSTFAQAYTAEEIEAVRPAERGLETAPSAIPVIESVYSWVEPFNGNPTVIRTAEVETPHSSTGKKAETSSGKGTRRGRDTSF